MRFVFYAFGLLVWLIAETVNRKKVKRSGHGYSPRIDRNLNLYIECRSGDFSKNDDMWVRTAVAVQILQQSFEMWVAFLPDSTAQAHAHQSGSIPNAETPDHLSPQFQQWGQSYDVTAHFLFRTHNSFNGLHIYERHIILLKYLGLKIILMVEGKRTHVKR